MPIHRLSSKEITNRQRVLMLLTVMAAVALTVMGISLWFLYNAAFDERRSNLVEIAFHQAKLIEAVARYGQDANPSGARAATLAQVIDAHAHHHGFGKTGEFTLGMREDDNIRYLLSFRHQHPEARQRLPFHGELAEPMRRALKGKSGSLVGLDYRGIRVLAAHEPLSGLDAGIVAKVDLDEIRAPFIKAGILSFAGTLMIITLGTALFRYFGSPLVEQLESAVAVLRNAQRIAHLGNWEWDIKHNIVRWSEEVYRIMGLDPTRQTPSYELFLSTIHPDDRDRIEASVNASLEGNAPSSAIEHRFVLPDGRERFAQSQAETFFDKAGKPIRMAGTVQDISERKLAELTLLDRELSAREQLESRVKERTLELTSLNEELRSEVEVREQTQDELSRSLIYQEIIASILKLSLQTIPLVELLRQSLALVLNRHKHSLTHQGCIFLVEEDSGELVMEVHQGLSESNIDACGRIPFGHCLCGLAAQSGQIIYSDCIDERHEYTYSGIDPHGHYCVPIQDEGELFGVLNLYLPDGHQQSVDEEQLVLVIANTLAGVIRRRRAEEALRESEANLAEAQNIAHIGSWNWEVDRNKLSWSDEIYRIFGVSSKEFGASYEAFIERVHPADRKRVNLEVENALNKHQGYTIEHRIVRPDGNERTVRERARVSFDADGHPVRMFGTVQDITENERIKQALLRLKEELENKERSRLAALLHDGVGQNLQAIHLGLKMVTGKTDPDVAGIITELNAEVRSAIVQIRNLSSELSPIHLEQMDLAEAIHAHVSKVMVRVKADIRLNTDQQCFAFLDDRIKLHCFLVFQEALANAIKHSDASVIEIDIRTLGETWLQMEIEDNGSGFSPRKRLVQDNGLGISIIQDRAQRLGGKVDIHSTPGKGTKVTVRCPLQ